MCPEHVSPIGSLSKRWAFLPYKFYKFLERSPYMVSPSQTRKKVCHCNGLYIPVILPVMPIWILVTHDHTDSVEKSVFYSYMCIKYIWHTAIYIYVSVWFYDNLFWCSRLRINHRNGVYVELFTHGWCCDLVSVLGIRHKMSRCCEIYCWTLSDGMFVYIYIIYIFIIHIYANLRINPAYHQ